MVELALPNLRELYWEPQRRLHLSYAKRQDDLEMQLLRSLVGKKLDKLEILEDANQVDPIPSRDHNVHQLTEELVIASRDVKHMFLFFMVDARVFFEICRPEWNWERLESLQLTSSLLDPPSDTNSMLQRADYTNNMLERAGTVARKMPKLQSMMLRSAVRENAGVFQYRAPAAWDRPGMIAWRASWPLEIERRVVDAWTPVAAQREVCRQPLKVCCRVLPW
ncbi:hypothetical protein B0T14DRAFT_301214 [Immersiella caudata]|uniref:DUF6546 domain-containing protein n=1 Tax=Immersiella caudata TaxID=314043 RepID=A0AA39WF56_9PEZI|nr:hypothetical protein B0T14DRAFT_301214 [Immersiella caudata]